MVLINFSFFDEDVFLLFLCRDDYLTSRTLMLDIAFADSAGVCTLRTDSLEMLFQLEEPLI